ncbi:MAG: DUF4126 domain-containing protein [Desulfobulbaceae bacterium]|nr:DUF4126 domain-containing protein [Desulfobulbaceae bacterium]
MDQYSQIVSTLALSMGLGWASGINLYAALFMLGALGASGNMTLPPDLQVLATPVVIIAAGAMYVAEFVADKAPGVDTGWDMIHTFIRIPAGALLAAGAVGEINPPLAVAAGIVGAGLAASTHTTKASSRILINTSPEPISNWLASLGEDIAVVAGLWTAIHHPWLFISLLALFLLLLIWLLPKLWAGTKQVLATLRRLFRTKTDTPPPAPLS